MGRVPPRLAARRRLSRAPGSPTRHRSRYTRARARRIDDPNRSPADASEEAYRQRLPPSANAPRTGRRGDRAARIRIARPPPPARRGLGAGRLAAWARTSSARMVELGSRAGVTAVLARPAAAAVRRRLLDCAARAWSVYHVPTRKRRSPSWRAFWTPAGCLASTGSDDDLERRLAWARLFDEEPQPRRPRCRSAARDGLDLPRTSRRRAGRLRRQPLRPGTARRLTRRGPPLARGWPRASRAAEPSAFRRRRPSSRRARPRIDDRLRRAIGIERIGCSPRAEAVARSTADERLRGSRVRRVSPSAPVSSV